MHGGTNGGGVYYIFIMHLGKKSYPLKVSYLSCLGEEELLNPQFPPGYMTSVEKHIPFKKESLTSDNQFSSFRNERILALKTARSHLTLPYTIIIFQVGIQNSDRTVSFFWGTSPLVLGWIHPHRITISFPSTFTLFVGNDTRHHYTSVRVNLLVSRLLGPFL